MTEGGQLTLEVRRDCDLEYLRRASEFIRAAAARDVPFFVYFDHSLMHMPVIPRLEFKGQTGQGDWADSLALAVRKYSTDPIGKLPSPRIINLIADPRNANP